MNRAIIADCVLEFAQTAGPNLERMEPLQRCMADLCCGDFVSCEIARKIFIDEYSRAELHKDARELKQDFPEAS